MKVIFLDIDGVLNCATTTQRWRGFIGMDPVMVERFNQLVKDSGASVVLSSTWRLDDDWPATMKANGLGDYFIGRTPRLTTTRYPSIVRGYVPRGEEIEHWLKEHPEVVKYAIIDDDSDFLPEQPHFKTNWSNVDGQGGLTSEVADKVREYLSKD